MLPEPFPFKAGDRVRDRMGQVGVAVRSVQNRDGHVRYDVPCGASGPLRMLEYADLLRRA